MIDEIFFLGQPYHFFSGIYVYPPLVKDVLNENYGLYTSLLTYSQEDIEDEFLENKKET
jgi:hypothetical protein